eukprot:768518-Hanusia_phi.AAC.4
MSPDKCGSRWERVGRVMASKACTASALGLRANEEGKLVADESSLEGEEPEVGGQESEIVGWSGATMAKRSFILGNCFFAELSSLLLSVGGRRLTQYLDDVFGRKYHCTMKFLEDLEMRCLNREEAEALRNHVSLQDFLQKWELPLRAFVQLRQQEVSQSLSALLLTPSQLSEAIKERERQAQAGTAAEEDNKDGRENKQDGDPVEEVQEFSAERPPLPTYKEDEHSTSTPFYLKVLVGLTSSPSLQTGRAHQVAPASLASSPAHACVPPPDSFSSPS